MLDVSTPNPANDDNPPAPDVSAEIEDPPTTPSADNPPPVSNEGSDITEPNDVTATPKPANDNSPVSDNQTSSSADGGDAAEGLVQQIKLSV